MTRNNVLWFSACLGAGIAGTFALLIPLFGFLSYLGALLSPAVVLAELVLGLIAVLVRGRWRQTYVLGNLGILAGTAVLFLVSIAFLVVNPRYQPDPAVWAPAYFGIVMMGLSGGLTLAFLMRRHAR